MTFFFLCVYLENLSVDFKTIGNYFILFIYFFNSTLSRKATLCPLSTRKILTRVTIDSGKERTGTPRASVRLEKKKVESVRCKIKPMHKRWTKMDDEGIVLV